MKTVSIILADDHEVVRDGLKAMLARHKEYVVIGEASNGQEALEKVKNLHPAILLMDISMPGVNGMEAARIIAKEHPDVKVIILSMHQDIEHISECLESDVMGFVVKTEGGKELIKALEAVAHGKKFYSDAVTKAVLEKYASQRSPSKQPEQSIELTSREKEIIQFIGQGWTNQRIADKLFISFRTVETHRANLMRKLEAKNSIELVNNARKHRIIE
jgi:DNA-binding NarL/FixJ family response regulator